MSRKKYFKLTFITMLTRVDEKLLKELAGNGVIESVVEDGKLMLESRSLAAYLESAGKNVPDILKVDKQKVLIVDDDPLVINSLKRMLMAYSDVIVSSASHAFEMGRLLNVDMPDLVILDFNMPGINGLEVLKQLKADSDTADTRVIIYSGNLPESVYGDMATMRPYAIVQKSGDAAEIMNTIKKALT